jgi:hypothetical protein
MFWSQAAIICCEFAAEGNLTELVRRCRSARFERFDNANDLV